MDTAAISALVEVLWRCIIEGAGLWAWRGVCLHSCVCTCMSVSALPCHPYYCVFRQLHVLTVLPHAVATVCLLDMPQGHHQDFSWLTAVMVPCAPERLSGLGQKERKAHLITQAPVRVAPCFAHLWCISHSRRVCVECACCFVLGPVLMRGLGYEGGGPSTGPCWCAAAFVFVCGGCGCFAAVLVTAG